MTSTRRILIVGSEESGACKMLNLVFGGDAFEGESDDASVKRVKRDFLGMIQLDLLGCCGLVEYFPFFHSRPRTNFGNT